ncbi:hypothetical protein D3C77_598460 [compost metagenome]
MHEPRQIDMTQLNRRKVDGDSVWFSPSRSLTTGLAQNPLADGQYEPGLFGDGNKVRRRDVTAFVVLPA